jgi:uncharacterized SAM-binding protein YcdF (DUF218 family)
MRMKVNPTDPDAIIIIFGAAVRPDGSPSQTLRYRVAAAVRFGSRFGRPLFIPTGARGRFGETEATVMARLLLESGVPQAAIVKEETGTDTLSSARAVVALMQRQFPAFARIPAAQSPARVRSEVYACTSAYHLPRCLVLLRLAGVAAQACPPPPVPAATSQWQRWYWRLRETPALPYDALLMVWLRVTRRAISLEENRP